MVTSIMHVDQELQYSWWCWLSILIQLQLRHHAWLFCYDPTPFCIERSTCPFQQPETPFNRFFSFHLDCSLVPFKRFTVAAPLILLESTWMREPGGNSNVTLCLCCTGEAEQLYHVCFACPSLQNQCLFSVVVFVDPLLWERLWGCLPLLCIRCMITNWVLCVCWVLPVHQIVVPMHALCIINLQARKWQSQAHAILEWSTLYSMHTVDFFWTSLQVSRDLGIVAIFHLRCCEGEKCQSALTVLETSGCELYGLFAGLFERFREVKIKSRWSQLNSH